MDGMRRSGALSGALFILVASSAVAAEPAILEDIRVSARQVRLKLSKPVGFRTAVETSPPALIVTLENTELSAVARDKSVAGVAVVSIESSQVRIDGVPRARVVVKLDAPRAYEPVWSAGELILELKEPVTVIQAPERRRPTAPESGAGSTWRIKGRLLDSMGKPLSGRHAVTFRLRPAVESGKETWSESLQVRVDSGTFWAVLGRTRPIPASAAAGQRLVLESASGSAKETPYWVQAASLPKQDRALKLKGELEPKVGKIVVREAKVGGAAVHRVLVGPFEDRASAQDGLDRVSASGHSGFLIQD